MSGPLEGIRVLDMGAYGVGPHACGMLGLLGAEVIRIEPDTGDGLMRVAPFINGTGSTYLVAHHNAKSIVLNLKNDEEKKIAYNLLGAMDVLVENRRTGALDRLGFGYDVVSKINPRIIYASSSAYGHTGPFVKFGGTDTFLQAMSGFVSLNGKLDGLGQWLRYVALVDCTGSLVIAEACLAGLYNRELTGKGEYLDLDEFSSSLYMQSTRIAEYLATRQEPRRMGSESSKTCPSRAYITQDNKYVLVSALTRGQWTNLCAALEMNDLVDDPRFCTNNARLEHRDEVNEQVQQRIQDKPLVWWLWQFDRFKVTHSKVMNVEDLLDDPHVIANKYIVDMPSAWGPLKYADNVPWTFQETPLNPTTPTPYPDEHRDYVLSLISGDSRPPLAAPAPRKQAVRVVDLTQGIAGPQCTAQLGSLGIEVIKVETGEGDYARDWGARVNGESAIFMQLNHDKKSVKLDYRTPEGLDALRALVRGSDVFIEDFKPGEAESLGLGYEDLRKLKKDLIYCSIYPFGDKGPYRDREATELELQGMSVMMRWIGELGEEPVRLGADLYSSLTGMFAFCAVMAALYNKQKRHKGERIVVSAFGGAIYLAQDGILPLSGVDSWGGYWATGPYDHAVSGLPAKDKHIMFGVMVKDEEQGRPTLEKFCTALGMADHLKDPEFVKIGTRLKGMGQEAAQMRPVFEPYIRRMTAEKLVETIDACGGLGAIVLSYNDLFNPMHQQVIADQMTTEQEHPRAGRIILVNNPWRPTATQMSIRTPSPALGEHTDEVLAALGYPRARIEALKSGAPCAPAPVK
ncbi:MAG: CoA transferase [Chloroflexi bacterium]|nr:CoA transferase [Chloroflexota bacterium]